MEKYKCKLCSKAFGNGRALGGHMRSHLVNLPIPPKGHQHPQRHDQLSDPAESGLSLSSFSSEERESEEKGLGCYGLRENPRKSFRLVDPEFLDAASVVQDRESETESSRRNPSRRRSKRARRAGKPSSAESVTELEQASSVSDASREEDVALCLIMLSRDTWSSDEADELRPSQREYKCETCKKVFGSFQALGGHRTSHTKTKSTFQDVEEEESRQRRKVGTTNGDQKLHECPICFRVFGSGQALGGHKRSHFSTSSSAAAQNSAKFGDNLIDLNLPASMEEDEINKPEVSAVSDAEFIKQSHTLHSH